MDKPNKYVFETISPNVHRFVFEVKPGFEQWFLLSGDRHHDNEFCRRDLEKKHLDEAMSRNAFVLDVGDLFDVMQGKGDKRSSKNELRNEHKRVDYLDSVVNEATEFYSPYADIMKLVGVGNHESAILNLYGTNLIDRFADRMRLLHKSDCCAGGYGGWVLLKFNVRKTVSIQKRIKYFHGAGGADP